MIFSIYCLPCIYSVSTDQKENKEIPSKKRALAIIPSRVVGTAIRITLKVYMLKKKLLLLSSSFFS